MALLEILQQMPVSFQEWDPHGASLTQKQQNIKPVTLLLVTLLLTAAALSHQRKEHPSSWNPCLGHFQHQVHWPQVQWQQHRLRSWVNKVFWRAQVWEQEKKTSLTPRFCCVNTVMLRLPQPVGCGCIRPVNTSRESLSATSAGRCWSESRTWSATCRPSTDPMLRNVLPVTFISNPKTSTFTSVQITKTAALLLGHLCPKHLFDKVFWVRQRWVAGSLDTSLIQVSG